MTQNRSRSRPEGEILLKAKIFRPLPRAGAVRRERLTGRLDELLRPGLPAPLGLVSAPPGFGKTSLLAEWAQGCAAPVAWLTLDAADNDPTRFLTYLVAAIRGALPARPTIGEDSAALLAGLSAAPVEAALASLLADLELLDELLVVVLDDFQSIDAPAIHGAMRFLVEQLPPNLRVVLASRSDPPLPLASLRARGQLVEIRASDLRFSNKEAGQFLAGTAGLAPEWESGAGDLVTVLADRTEGWAAGLQMAALSLAGRAGWPEEQQAFVQQFSGSNRYVLDYLTEEVLARLPEETVSFLLHSAILERFCAGLCAAVLAEAEPRSPGEAQAMLEYLERANLFLIALDDTRGWYRYHHLFADLLRARLKQRHAGRIPGLHGRAAEWYRQEGLPAEAVGHLLAAGAAAGREDAQGWYEKAARLIEESAMRLFLRGESATFIHWLEALPDGVRANHPLLDLYRAAVYGLQGDPDSSERLTGQVMARLGQREQGQARPAGFDAVVNNLAGIQAAQHDLQDRPAEVIRLAARTLPNPGLDPINRVTLLLSLGHAHFSRGDLEAALQAWSEAERQVDPQHNPYGLALATAHQARAERLLGRLVEAQARLEAGLAQLKDREDALWMGLSVVETGLGDILRERGRLVEARQLLLAAAAHPARFGGLNGRVLGGAALARLRLAEGDSQGALAALTRVETYLPHRGIYPEYREEAEVARALAWLGAGRWQEAGAYAEKVAPEAEGLRGELARITAARVRLGLGQTSQAAGALARLAGQAEAGGRWSRAIEARALLAVALYLQEQPEAALAELGQALAAAAPRGFVRAVLDAGVGQPKGLVPGLLGLGIRRSSWPGEVLSYAKVLLEHCPAGESEAAALFGEVLSEREMAVLALVAEGLSNAEIAARLVITTGTVRVHTANIYRKLDTTNRTQAVARARELGIL